MEVYCNSLQPTEEMITKMKYIGKNVAKKVDQNKVSNENDNDTTISDSLIQTCFEKDMRYKEHRSKKSKISSEILHTFHTSSAELNHFSEIQSPIQRK